MAIILTRLSIIYVLCFLMMLTLVMAALMLGPVVITPKQLIQILVHTSDHPFSLSYQVTQADIIWQLRLPRVVAVLFVGLGLGLSGAVLQSLLRNPLADPALLGISSGADLTIMLLIILGVSNLSPFAMPLAAFFGGFLVVLLLYGVAHVIQPGRIGAVLLSGIAMNAILAAIISMLLYLANSNEVQRIVFWSFGNINNVSWPLVMAVIVTIGIGSLLLFSQARGLNVWALGESAAFGLGLHTKSVLACCLIGIALVVGACVAVAGPIAFIGLIVPHMARFLVGSLAQRLLPLSALLGACLLLLADMLCHAFHPPMILPLGIATALLGAPMFIALLFHYRANI